VEEAVAARAQHAAKAVSILIMTGLCGGARAQAQTTAEASIAGFSGKDLSAGVQSLRASTTGDFFFEKERLLPSTVIVQGTVIQTRAKDSYGVEKDSVERRANIGFTQSFGKLTSLSLGTGYVKNTGFSRYSSATFGQWWNKATILTEVTYSASNSERSSRDYLDTDGFRVVVPPRSDGRTGRFGLTWLARPDLMLITSASTSVSSDRPKSNAVTAETRYFFQPTLTAFHVGYDRYVDTAQVKKTTDYGRVSAWSGLISAHQHLSDQWILSLYEREHFETETPRSADTAVTKRHTRENRVKLRWRHVTGPVTDDVPEVSVFAGSYYSFADESKINHLGLGGKYVF
jgi:hypothetical protein